MISEIPARNDLPWYKFKITFEGTVYTLRFIFNTRMNRWILDIADSGDNDIICGLPILIERDIAGQYVIVGLPPGILFSRDNQTRVEQPSRYSFGMTHSLLYEDSSV